MSLLTGDTHVEETKELTQMNEGTTQIVVHTHDQLILVPDGFANPFPDQTPVSILERLIRVGVFTWQIGVPFAQILSFPQALWVPTTISALRTLRYMRADVEVQVRLNSSPFQYGALLVSWLPNHSNSSHCQTLIQQSGNNPVVLSASQQTSVTFTIPWTCPHAFFEATQNPLFMAPPNGSSIGRVNISQLTPLRVVASDTSPSAEVSVFARFVNVQTAACVTAQSEAKTKSIENIIDGVTGTKVASQLFPLVKSLSELLAFDFPPSLQAKQNMQITMGHVTQGKGLETAPYLSIEPDARLPHPGNMIGNRLDCVSLYEVIQRPMLRRVLDFTNQTPDDSEICRPMVPTDIQPDYVAFVSNMFRFWRGGLKYCLQFFTSPMISGRFRVSLLHFAPTVSADTKTSGDIISKTVDVKGDTTVMFSVPYLWSTFYRAVGTDDAVLFPLLRVEMITPIFTSDATITPHIYCAIWRSADKDFQLVQYVAPVRVTAQSNLVTIFADDFEAIIGFRKPQIEERFMDAERLITLPDLWKRYNDHSTFSANPVDVPSVRAVIS